MIEKHSSKVSTSVCGLKWYTCQQESIRRFARILMMNELLGEVASGVEGVPYRDDLLILVIIVLIP